MAEAALSSIRVLAFSAKNAGTIETVNIITAKKTEHRQHLQLTGAQAAVQTHRTVMDSGGTKSGLRTICISGYSAPN